VAYSDARPLDTVILNVYGSGKGNFNLYEDDGVSLGYTHGRYALTPMTHATTRDGFHQVVIGPTQGTFAGELERRSYELHIHSMNKPQSVSVNGSAFNDWTWDAGAATATILLPARSTRDRAKVEWASKDGTD
jgi:hypothetical protein